MVRKKRSNGRKERQEGTVGRSSRKERQEGTAGSNGRKERNGTGGAEGKGGTEGTAGNNKNEGKKVARSKEKKGSVAWKNSWPKGRKEVEEGLHFRRRKGDGKGGREGRKGAYYQIPRLLQRSCQAPHSRNSCRNVACV